MVDSKQSGKNWLGLLYGSANNKKEIIISETTVITKATKKKHSDKAGSCFGSRRIAKRHRYGHRVTTDVVNAAND